MIKKVFIAFFLLMGGLSYAQYSKDLCNDYGVAGCTEGSNGEGWVIGTSLEQYDWAYTSPNNSMPFWVAAKRSVSGLIDTAYNGVGHFELIDGPGTLTGTTYFPTFNSFQYIDDWKFSEPGSYLIKAVLTGATLDTFRITVVSPLDMCAGSPGQGCGSNGGDSLLVFRSSIVSVDAVYPISVGVLDKGTGLLDSSWFGTAKVEVVDGPGNMWGTSYISGSEWVLFVDLRFDEIGVYDVGVEVDGNKGLLRDTVSVEVVQSTAISEINTFKLESYPNPSSTEVNIKLKEENSNIIFYGMDGRIAKEVSFSSNGIKTVSLSDVAEGVYFLRVTNEESSSVYETLLTVIK